VEGEGVEVGSSGGDAGAPDWPKTDDLPNGDDEEV